jgi:serine/threonine protein kinase
MTTFSDDDPARPSARPRMDGVEGRRLEADVRSRLFGTAPAAVRVADYTIVRRLGRGGTGSVYLARSEGGHEVALKIVSAVGEQARARLRREARALATLAHPNIVRLQAVGDCSDGLYLAMDLVVGPSLREHLAAAPWTAIVRAMLDVAEALDAAHRVGVVHRDLKPENILVDAHGTLMLADFGLAKAIPGSLAMEQETLAVRLTRTGTALGTIGYAAPEQLTSRAVDGRTDQFAFCVTLFELLWRRLPFAGRTADAIGLAVISGRVRPPPGPSDVPSRVVAAILRGLAPDPAARHRDMCGLAAELRGALDEAG